MKPDNNLEEQKILAETVAMLRAVLISSPLGVKFDKLYRDYKQLTGKEIPYKQLGYDKLEFFIESIPDVARAEKGADGEWVLKGVASEADKHVAKLISKQKKPKVRKSAKLMVSKRPTKTRVSPVKFNTPVKHAPSWATVPCPTSKTYEVPPRMQKLHSQPKQAPQQAPNIGMPKNAGVSRNFRHSTSRGPANPQSGNLSQRTQESVQFSKTGGTSKTTNSHSHLYHTANGKDSNRENRSSGLHRTTVSVSNNIGGRDTRVVNVLSPGQNCSAGKLPTAPPSQDGSSDVLNDPAVVKWIKSEVAKSPNGLWATRLTVLYQEKFNKSLSLNSVKELKSRPDIVTVDEPIEGRYLLYASRQIQQPTAAVRAVEAVPSHQVFDVSLPYEFPEAGSCCLVYITHVESVGCFYVSKADSILESLNSEMLTYYEKTKYNSQVISPVSPDQIFCAQFTEDHGFYRARVLEVVDSKHVRVLYLDFGNQEVVKVESLRVLDKQFHSQPVQAFQCYLDGIEPASEEWSEAAVIKFKELSSDKSLKMTVKDIEEKVLRITLYDESQKLDIAEELARAGLAVSTKNLDSTPSSSSSSLSSIGGSSGKITPPKKDRIARPRRIKPKTPGVVEIPEEQYIDVYVCNITGTRNIFLRLGGEEHCKKFDALQESMTCYYNDSQGTSDEVTNEPAVGDLFALLSDEVWCRVKVVSISGPSIKVFFVDHGDNTETTKSKLQELATQFRQLPFQVFECALHGLPKTKDPDVVDKLRKLILGEVCVAEIIKRSAELVLVDLIDARNDACIVVNDVIRKLVISDEELKPELPQVGQTVEVEVSYVSPTGSVFLHVSEAGMKRLEEINNDLSEHYQSKRSKASEFISNPHPGKICCAKCDTDSTWYRAKIVSVSDKKEVKVLYIDYGNCEVVSSTHLREPTVANEHVLSLPAQALECQLYDIPKDAWNEDLAGRMMNILAESTVTAEVLSLVEGELPAVSLLVTIGTESDDEGSSTTQRLIDLLGIVFEGNYDDPARSEEDTDETVVRYDCATEENKEGAILDEKNTVSPEQDIMSDEGGNDAVGQSAELAPVTDETNTIPSEQNITLDERGNNVVGQCAEVRPVTNEKVTIPPEQDSISDERGSAVVHHSAETGPATDEKLNAQKNDSGSFRNAESYQVSGEFVDPRADAGDAASPWKELPLDQGWLDVLVTAVKDPGHFTFQLLPNLEEFDEMSEEMNKYYQENQAASDVRPVEGGVFAVYYEPDEWWYRTVVDSCLPNGKVYVVFLDYGGDATVEVDDVRTLEDQFLLLPFQGVEASLAGIKNTKPKWSKACIKDFKYLVYERQLVAKVTSGDTSYRFKQISRVVVELYDTSDPCVDVVIAEKVIEHNKEVVPG